MSSPKQPSTYIVKVKYTNVHKGKPSSGQFNMFGASIAEHSQKHPATATAPRKSIPVPAGWENGYWGGTFDIAYPFCKVVLCDFDGVCL